MNENHEILDIYRSNDRHQTAPIFVCEGRWVVENLLESTLAVHSVVLVEGHHEDLIERVPYGVPVLRISTQEAENLLGFRFHRGVLAAATPPEPLSLRQWLTAKPSRLADLRPLVIAPQLADPSNLGALIRNAAGLDAAAVVVGNTGASPWYRKAVRTSSGMVFKIPVLVSPELRHDLEWMRQESLAKIVALALTPSAQPIQQFTLGEKRLALLLGAEGPGLSHRWLRMCEETVRIPMANGVDSLNVATSAALLLYHCQHDRS